MEINGKNFTIGADPELFVADPDTGEFISAHDLVPGDKETPHPVLNGAVQVDGMALEYNVDPSENFEEFLEKITSVREILKDMIGDKVFLEQTSVFFDEEFLKDVPDMNKVLGCEPDYNGWTMDVNHKPEGNVLMRTVGGHVHIGGFFSDNPFEKGHFETCARLARILDETLGIPSLLWDKDDKRRELYGQAGCFRPKHYGMEYRTLSNAWIFDPKLVKFVYKGVETALKKMFEGYEPPPKVQNMINQSDRDYDFILSNPLYKEVTN